jgi:hypothetical protein
VYGAAFVGPAKGTIAMISPNIRMSGALSRFLVDI